MAIFEIKNMKRINILTIFTVALFLMGSKLHSQTVYITETGKKYHAKNCDVAKTGKKGVELNEAKKQGYDACKICKVEQNSKVNNKPKEKETTNKSKK